MSLAQSVLDDDVSHYWNAVSRADEHAATMRALDARDRGVPLEAVLGDLVVATQLRVGELWAGNEWSVAQEHAATAVAERVVRRLADDLPEPATGPLVTVACVEREWHALPALIVSATLRAHGVRTDFVGASPSRERLMSRILDTGPRVVLLSASLTSSLPRVRRQVEAVRGSGTPVVVGGRAFDAEGLRARRLGATAYAASPAAALALLDTLPRHVATAPVLRHPGAAEARALGARTDQVVREVTARTDRALGISGGGEDALAPDDWRVVLATFVPHLVDSLAGALLTEDPRVLTEALGWLDDVLRRRGADPRALGALTEALREQVRDQPEALRLLDG